MAALRVCPAMSLHTAGAAAGLGATKKASKEQLFRALRGGDFKNSRCRVAGLGLWELRV